MDDQKLIQTLFGLLMTAYGFIFYSVIGRLKKLEEVECDPHECQRRFTKVEVKQESIDPVLVEIRVKLASIEAILSERLK